MGCPFYALKTSVPRLCSVTPVPQTERFKVVAFRPHQAHPPGLESAPGNKHNSDAMVRNLEVSLSFETQSPRNAGDDCTVSGVDAQSCQRISKST